ncbi:MAG: hypothetical protein R3301_10060 [Saprospiraceae bacterium]|nr:hypothetical protein [Saprospiraceae bacterium]
MCIGKIPVSSPEEFEVIREKIEAGGYPYRSPEIDDGFVLLWAGDEDTPPHATGVKHSFPARCFNDLESLDTFLRGRRKTARRCKNGILQKDPRTGEVIAEYETVKEAAEALGVQPINIYRAANEFCSLKTAYGFVWEYCEPELSRMPTTKL